jgi:hypothetical protein
LIVPDPSDLEGEVLISHEKQRLVHGCFGFTREWSHTSIVFTVTSKRNAESGERRDESESGNILKNNKIPEYTRRCQA